ncbi:uncharacterized conserved protein [Longilinea arvoryzae]|uniref:Uncharacterized conserved protein n=1 Tax=Longilinea arvoryzae TaxID=360412 RepID=A0A0S7BJD5_9CHLR|nr:CHAD domain-containing protein [Longilinea arvoryzae]GAP15252.1 uncharacterized conserved protein [Longilinea arvoryzae]
MKTRTDASILDFGADNLLRNLGALQQEYEGVRQGKDIETIHRMRVASRRLRTGIPLFGPGLAPKKFEGWNQNVRELTKALGAARDCDVQIDHLQQFYLQLPIGPARPGVRRLLLRLRQRRQKLQRAVEKALADLVKSDVLMEMQRKLNPILKGIENLPRSAPLYALACTAVREKLEQFLYYEPFIQDPEDKDDLHAMRIAAKHLRYTLEIFSPLYADELKLFLKALRQTQELLGEIHDCDVWMIYLPEFKERERIRTLRYYGSEGPFRRLVPGLDAYFADRTTTRDRLYVEFLEKWQSWRQEGLWDQLINQVSTTYLPAVQAQLESVVDGVAQESA